jgi:threonine/homoserine/homoserine lactone efflux protein
MGKRFSALGKIFAALIAPWTERKLWMVLIGIAIMQQIFWVWVYYSYSFTEQWRADMVAIRYDHLQNWIGGILAWYLGLRTGENFWELHKTGTTTGQPEHQ